MTVVLFTVLENVFFGPLALMNTVSPIENSIAEVGISERDKKTKNQAVIIPRGSFQRKKAMV